MGARKPLQYLLVTAKGMAMGAADVVPGVSGGTIAFISGIYEELVETLDKLDLKFFSLWKKLGFKAAWNEYNLTFLVCLFAGVGISIISLAKLITFLLDTYPLQVWAFFFGLVVASILYVGRQITHWNFKIWIAIIIAAVLSYYITIAKPVGTPEDTWFLFFAGFIAIIAMILPGVSGAFILLLLGAYKPVIGTIGNLSEAISTSNFTLLKEAVLKLMVFGLGAIVGLKSFSKVLNWLFKHHKNIILAALTGFMVGALNKIWPWKKVLEYRINSEGHEVPFLEQSVLPSSYNGDAQLLAVCIFAIVGFLLIFILERLAASKKM